MIRKYILILLSAIFCLGCEEDRTVDTTVMPEISNIGADTFGCLIDGWLYVGGRYGAFFLSIPTKEYSISFCYNEYTKVMDVKVLTSWDRAIRFTIQSPKEGEESIFSNVRFGNQELEDGTVQITRFDKQRQIISGTFSGGRITHGRFDTHYTTYTTNN